LSLYRDRKEKTRRNRKMSERLAYSVKEFRKKTGLSKNLTYKLLETGTLKSVRAGRRILIPAWAVEDFLRKAK